MKINKSKAPVKGWVKKALCGGVILGLAASMSAPTAMASGFEEFTPFTRIATLPADGDGFVRARAAAEHLAEYVARTKDSGKGGDWVLGGTSKNCRKHITDNPLVDCTDDEIKHAILGIPSPDPIIKKANVLDFCNEHYAKRALGVAPIIGDKGDPEAKYVVNGYSHTPALPCKVSVWSDGAKVYVDMKDPNAIFRMFFTDVLFSEEMTDEDFANAISELPQNVKDEIMAIVRAAMLEFDPNADVEIETALGPSYTSMAQVIEAVDAAPEDSPYKHVAYRRKGGGDFDSTDAAAVTQAIINTMSIHGETVVFPEGTDPRGPGVHNDELESILSESSMWRSARSAPLPLPGKNYVIEACSPTYAKMAMSTGMHHVTALPCEITVQVIDRVGDDSKETLVVSYLDPHFMLGALFADISDEDKEKFADIPGNIMDDLQKIVAAALDDSGYVLTKGKQIYYDMLPVNEDNDDQGNDDQ
jgi:uncharacterized protein (DUF302 family)